MSDKKVRATYFGKYRGTVFDNADLDFKGRIQAMVPDVLGMTPSTWATPCVPITGLSGVQSGCYVVPPIGANVWIEFEHGNPDYPIWSGCFWGSQMDVPLVAQTDPALPSIVLQSVGQNIVWIGGDPATGITISCGPAASPTSPRIMISAAGIIISDGQGGMINLAAGVVTVNLGALIVK